MLRFSIGLLGALVAVSPLTAATNIAVANTNLTSTTAASVDDPVEREYKKLMEDDDAAQADVEQ